MFWLLFEIMYVCHDLTTEKNKDKHETLNMLFYKLTWTLKHSQPCPCTHWSHSISPGTPYLTPNQ